MLEFKDAMEYTPVLTSVMRQTLDIIRASVGQQQFASMQFVDLGAGRENRCLCFICLVVSSISVGWWGLTMTPR